MERKYDVITLGEILLRLSTPINGRLAEGDTLMRHLGGAELNIASEIGQLGLKTAIISKIPGNLLSAFIRNQLNASRVSESYLISDTGADSRIGIYYYEYGSILPSTASTSKMSLRLCFTIRACFIPAESHWGSAAARSLLPSTASVSLRSRAL